MADEKKFDPLARTRLDSGRGPGSGGSTRIKDILTSLGEMPEGEKSEPVPDVQEKTLLLGRDQSPETLMGWLVEVDPHTGPVRSHELRRKKYIIGRGAKADIRLDNRTVSREHCTIIWKGDKFEILDSDSGNGVLVDGYPRMRSILADGTNIRVGDVELWVKLI